MLLFPNAKINLGLSVVRKRPDGYHDLETVFVPVGWYDALEFVPSEQLHVHTHGLAVPIPPESNLVWKAYQLMKQEFPALPSLDIHLQKNIPHGAGLGGGSADAAFMLRGLNDYFKLGLSLTQLVSMALELGSDCPFFIYNKPCLAHGRGELLQPINIDWKDHRIVLIKPPFPISTALAFQSIIPKPPTQSLPEIIAQPISMWRNTLVNDFEEPLSVHYPDIAFIRNTLYDAGCLYAALSGSGSTVFGIFKRQDELRIQEGIDLCHKKIRDVQVHITDFIIG